MSDPVNPDYYTDTKISVLQVVDDWQLPPRLACTLKYLKRYRAKPDPVFELRKAIRYLELEVERLEGAKGHECPGCKAKQPLMMVDESEGAAPCHYKKGRYGWVKLTYRCLDPANKLVECDREMLR